MQSFDPPSALSSSRQFRIEWRKLAAIVAWPVTSGLAGVADAAQLCGRWITSRSV